MKGACSKFLVTALKTIKTIPCFSVVWGLIYLRNLIHHPSAKMKLEEIIPLLGNFSRYQFFMVCYINVLSLFGCLTTLSNVFYAAETDHWCKVFPNENCSSWVEFQDNCTDVKKSFCLPPSDEESKYPYSNCEQWDPPNGYKFDPYVSYSDIDNYTYTRVACKDGWEYDSSQYKTTTISEVGLIYST